MNSGKRLPPYIQGCATARGANGNLIIFTEASGVIEPGEGVFNHPAPKGSFPLVGLDFLRNINVKSELFFCIRNESAPISGVGAELLNRWIPLIRSSCGRYPAFCVMNISRMDHNRQQTAQHIHYDVPLSAFCFFPPFIPRSSLAVTVFTLWESMTA